MSQKKARGPVEQLPFYHGGDGFDLAFADYMYGKNGKLVSSFLNEKKHTIKDTEQSYRVINHWSSLGLLDDERDEDSRQWRKLSTLDIVWLNLLAEMRKFGFPLEKMQVAKRTMFHGDVEHPYLLLEFAIANVLQRNSQQVVMVLEDGKAGVLSEQMAQMSRDLFKLESYLLIDLNAIVSRIYKGKDFAPLLTHSVSLTNAELEVLFEMRLGNCSSVNVKMKDGSVELIEATQTVEGQKRFVDLLKEGHYQDIEVKQRDGKIVSIKCTKQHRPKATGKTRASSTSPSRSSDNPKSNADHTHDQRRRVQKVPD